MKKFIASCVLSGGLLLGSVVGVSAADHSTPGTPGAANCVGQTNAFLAQEGQSQGIHGIGGVANEFGLSVQEVQAIVQSFCSGA